MRKLQELEPFLGCVNGVLGQASQAAECFSNSLCLEMPGVQMEADDLFACDRAHLLALEDSSY